MTDLLIYGAYTSRAARKILTSLSESVIIFEIDEHIPDESVTPDMSIQTYKSYLSEADYEDINRFVLEFMQKSFHVDGEDLTEWQGVSLGRALAVEELLMSTITITKNALCARRVFEQERPGRIYLGDGLELPQDVWRVEAERAGIPCVILEPDPPIPVDPRWIQPKATEFSQSKPPRQEFLPLLRRIWIGACMIQMSISWLGKQVIEWLSGYSKRPCVIVESGDTELALRLKQSSQVKVKYVEECAPALLQYLTYQMAERKARPVFNKRWEHMKTAGFTTPLAEYQSIDLWQYLSITFEGACELDIDKWREKASTDGATLLSYVG